jgi:CO/xanthine dehydrogenase FAD-binding subunit
MILPRFDVLVPQSLDEACRMLTEYYPRGIQILAGGTDLLVNLRKPIIPQHVPRCDGCARHPAGMVRSTIDCDFWDSEPLADAGGPLRSLHQDPLKASPKFLISLHKLGELKGIKGLSDGALEIGAMTTITEIERSPEIRRSWQALAEGADNLGSPLVRNRGTLGGNIANARPAADLAVPTIGLGAKLTLRSLNGERTLASEDFPRAPGVTEIKPDEILTAVTYPASPPHSGSAYYKLATRKALEISMVGISVWLALESPDGPIKDVRITLGAVGPTPLVAESVKDILIGEIPDAALFRRAARAAAGDARPIDDHRGSARYRLQMVEHLSERLLKNACERAGNNR